MSAYQKFNAFVENVFEKVHNLQSDTLKVLLTNTAPIATNAVKGDLTEITPGNGYSAGGPTATVSSSAQTSGTYKLVLADITITAGGGSIGPFRYAVLYNSTPSSPLMPLIGFWDYGSALTLADGESVVIDFDGTNGVLQCA